MPILLKKIDGRIISLFGGDDADFIGTAILINNVVGEIGLEDYISLTAFEAFTQNFSEVIDAEYCTTTPITYGPNGCSNYSNLSLSF